MTDGKNAEYKLSISVMTACILGACHVSEVASVTDKIKIVHITIIPIESIIMKIVATVLPLLEGENKDKQKCPKTLQQPLS